MNNVLDALRPGDPAKSTEPAKEKASAGSDNLGQIIVSELQAMQKALKEEQELVVTVNTGQRMPARIGYGVCRRATFWCLPVLTPIVM